MSFYMGAMEFCILLDKKSWNNYTNYKKWNVMMFFMGLWCENLVWKQISMEINSIYSSLSFKNVSHKKKRFVRKCKVLWFWMILKWFIGEFTSGMVYIINF